MALLRRSILSVQRQPLLALAFGASSSASSVPAAVPDALHSAMVASPSLARVMASPAQTRSIAASATLSADLQQALKPKMMCMQCEQTANQTGCTVVGQCGKSPEVAGLQDLLIHSLKGLATLAEHARAVANVSDPEVDSFMLRATFSTLTNVNFDDARFQEYINHCLRLHARLADKVKAAGKPLPQAPALTATPWFEASTGHPLAWNASLSNTELDMAELLDLSKRTGILNRQEVLGKTIAGLQELVVYGIKGVCAYAAHAEALGAKDDKVYADVHRAMAFLGKPEANDPNQLLELALAVGQTNFRVMQMLSEAHSDTFGHPEPTEVTLVPRNGKCILVTGHDMHDLHMLLQQIDAMGVDVDVYTHGEMLPAHGYPGLRKYKHLAGHYGGAWYQQKKDFVGFPGAILATTNCVMEPMALYRQNLFTTNETGLANVNHVGSKDFSAVINRALQLPGWTDRNKPRTVLQGSNSSSGRGAAAAAAQPQKTAVTVGFGHHAVLGVADKVIGAVNEGKLKHIFLVGGCDGHEPQRAYYAGLGNHLPKETMLLTLGCGKFRLIDQEFGTLGDTGLPRLLDMGQCNDAYSALVVATELAKAFKTDVNSLPLSLDLSWLEQKAVAVLLTLLSLGVKNIRLGPTMPAFLTPDAVKILVDTFQLKPADTTHPELDLKAMMARA